MKEIKVRCKVKKYLALEDFSIFESKLKKHSLLEIFRIKESIEKIGICFPITVAKLNDKNYIVDGEATYYALCELKKDYEISEIPVVFVRCKTEEFLRKLILIRTSINHCVTETSLKEFVKDTNIDLKKYAFNTPDLIDFHNELDISIYNQVIGGKFSDKKLNPEQFEELLK